jgi:predicted ATPase
MPFNGQNFFVISGGPGSLKTHRSGRIIQAGLSSCARSGKAHRLGADEKGGTALPWQDGKACADLMLERSIELYVEHGFTLTPKFSDRGIPNILGYAGLIGLEDIARMEDACARYRYAPIVFMAPPWEEIYHTDKERRQDFAEAGRTYTYHAFVGVREPRAARAEFILARLHSTP